MHNFLCALPFYSDAESSVTCSVLMRKKLHYIIIHYHELSLLLRVEYVHDWFS